MTDAPALWINGGILVLTGVMALVAFVHARAALRDAGKAEDARDKAVAAHEASATALAEANQIAADARDVLLAREARETERHRVEWAPFWDWQRGVWLLGNHGPDTAYGARLSVQSNTIGRKSLPEEDVPKDEALPIEILQYRGGGGQPYLHWSVDWRTALGAERHAAGDWPDP